MASINLVNQTFPSLYFFHPQSISISIFFIIPPKTSSTSLYNPFITRTMMSRKIVTYNFVLYSRTLVSTASSYCVSFSLSLYLSLSLSQFVYLSLSVSFQVLWFSTILFLLVHNIKLHTQK